MAVLLGSQSLTIWGAGALTQMFPPEEPLTYLRPLFGVHETGAGWPAPASYGNARSTTYPAVIDEAPTVTNAPYPLLVTMLTAIGLSPSPRDVLGQPVVPGACQ